MRTFTIFCLLLLSVSASASTLLYNVRGYMMDRGQRIDFAALEYDQGEVLRVYTSSAAAANSGATTRIDGGGATLVPGLIDVHGHVRRYGAALATVDLTGAESEVDAAMRVADIVDAQPSTGGGWLEGWGWNQVLWPGQAFPVRDSLDAVVPDRPVVLRRVDGHAV